MSDFLMDFLIFAPLILGFLLGMLYQESSSMAKEMAKYPDDAAYLKKHPGAVPSSFAYIWAAHLRKKKSRSE